MKAERLVAPALSVETGSGEGVEYDRNEEELLRNVVQLLQSNSVPEGVKASVKEILLRNPDLKYQVIAMRK